MRKNQKANLGSLKPSSRNRISKDTPHSSPISKYFIKPNSENNQEKQNQSSKQPSKRKTVLSDDDGDFESPKVQKKKIIKWELTKTKVYSKKSTKNKKPVTNSTIKIIEDNFKDLDVNSEHLQMGIALSKSEYEASKQDSQPPLEESPDFNALTGTILERFGFQSDKPVNRVSNFNAPEKSKKRKFKYTTPILITRTKADREALLTANISLILSKNTRRTNRKEHPTECQLFSEQLKKYWSKENRIFGLDAIYKTQRFTISDLNLSLDRAPCGYLLREWSVIPAISEEYREYNKNTIETSNEADLCSETIQSSINRHEKNKSYLDNANMAYKKNDKSALNIVEDEPLNFKESFVESEAIHKITRDVKSNKADDDNETENPLLKGSGLRKPSFDISGDLGTGNLVLKNSPVAKKSAFNRSISPDLFGSDGESSFTKCENISLADSLKHNGFDAFTNNKPRHDKEFTSNSDTKTSDITNKSGNYSDDDVIVVDDNDDDNKLIKTTDKVLSPYYDSPKSFYKHISTKTKVKYSFESDSDGESEIEKNNSKSNISDINNLVIDFPKNSISSKQKENVNYKFNSHNKLESKTNEPKTSSTDLSQKENHNIIDNKKSNIKYSFDSDSDIEICDEDNKISVSKNANDKYDKESAVKFYTSISKSTNFSDKGTSMTVKNHNFDLKTNIEMDFCLKDNNSNKTKVCEEDLNKSSCSFDSDSDIKFYDADNKSSDLENANNKYDKESADTIYNSESTSANFGNKESDITMKKHGFDLEVDIEKEYHHKHNKFIETEDCEKESSFSYEQNGEGDKEFKELSISNELGDSPRKEDLISQKNRKSELFFDENDSAYNNLDITGYINNMLDSQEDTFTNNVDTHANMSLTGDTIKTDQNNIKNNDSNSNKIFKLANNSSCTQSAVDDPCDLDENFSQASQSSSFLDELNKTDFCYIPPLNNEGLQRNSTGESGFWSEDKETDPIEILNEDTTEKSVRASTTKTESLKQCQTNFVTPDKSSDTKIIKNMIIKTHNVTPMQEYDNMNTPTINKELEKFGIKPLKRARGALLLKHIYESTHPYVNEGNENYQQDLDEDRRVTKKRKTNELFPPLAAVGGVEIVGDSLLENERPENLIFERKQSVKIKSCAVPLQIVWHNFVSSSTELKENILLYEPLELEILHQSIKDLGFKFHMQDLLTFLDKKCITVRIKR